MLPEFIIRSDGSWFGLSVYNDRITQMLVDATGDVGKEVRHLDTALTARPGRERRGHELAPLWPACHELCRG